MASPVNFTFRPINVYEGFSTRGRSKTMSEIDLKIHQNLARLSPEMMMKHQASTPPNRSPQASPPLSSTRSSLSPSPELLALSSPPPITPINLTPNLGSLRIDRSSINSEPLRLSSPYTKEINELLQNPFNGTLDEVYEFLEGMPAGTFTIHDQGIAGIGIFFVGIDGLINSLHFGREKNVLYVTDIASKETWVVKSLEDFIEQFSHTLQTPIIIPRINYTNFSTENIVKKLSSEPPGTFVIKHYVDKDNKSENVIFYVDSNNEIKKIVVSGLVAKDSSTGKKSLILSLAKYLAESSSFLRYYLQASPSDKNLQRKIDYILMDGPKYSAVQKEFYHRNQDDKIVKVSLVINGNKITATHENELGEVTNETHNSIDEFIL